MLAPTLLNYFCNSFNKLKDALSISSVNTSPPSLQELPPPGSSLKTQSNGKKKLLVIGCVFLGFCGIAAGSATWWYQRNFNASAFKPVQLSVTEQKVVEDKLATLDGAPPSDPSKTIVLNEREINGYLQQQGLGEKVKVSINDGKVAATVLAPVENDVPLFGGHTLRLKVAFNTKLDDQRRFALSLADVSISGISLPNAWLGGLKGLNLLSSSDSGNPDLVKGFAAGIKDFQMRNGEMRIVLNE